MKPDVRLMIALLFTSVASTSASADGFWIEDQGPAVIQDQPDVPRQRHAADSSEEQYSQRSLSMGDIGALQQQADYYEARTRLAKARAEYEQAKCEMSQQCGPSAAAAAQPAGPVGPFVLSILGSPNRGFTADLLIDGARVSVRERDILKAGLEVFEINSFGVKLRDSAGRLRELPMIGLILTD